MDQANMIQTFVGVSGVVLLSVTGLFVAYWKLYGKKRSTLAK